MELKKISDFKWEIPKTDGMRVPANIYASEKLISKIREDRTLEQLKNMACMPGIYKKAIALPDAHQGYGFCIGGVAALSTETGGLSPGGVGYDINCLCPDTKILTPLGCCLNISDLNNEDLVADNNSFLLYKTKQDFNAVSFNANLIGSKINYVMKKDTYKKILAVKTMLGRQIRCSEDHPILTEKGMIKAGELKQSDKVIITPFTGVSYEPLSDKELIGVASFTKEQKNELIKRNLLPLKENNLKLPYLARLMGYLFGDGTVYYSGKKGYVNFYGGEEDLTKIQHDLKVVGYNSQAYKRKRNFKIKTQYGEKEFTSENCELHCKSTSLARLLELLGAPVGNKTRQDYLVPLWILNSKLWIKRLFLSGFFSAELSKPKLTSKYNFYTPIISQNKSEKHIESMHNQ